MNTNLNYPFSISTDGCWVDIRNGMSGKIRVHKHSVYLTGCEASESVLACNSESVEQPSILVYDGIVSGPVASLNPIDFGHDSVTDLIAELSEAAGRDLDCCAESEAPTTSALKYVLEFEIADWVDAGTEYVIAVPAAVHKVGAHPIIQVSEAVTIGTPQYKVLSIQDELADVLAGNVTLRVTKVPDNRFDGKVVLI